MRRLLLILSVLFSAAAACTPSLAVQGEPAITPEARSSLAALRSEAKFRPHLRSGYTGADAPEDIAPLNAAVDVLIDQVLTRPNGPISEADVLPLIQLATNKVDLFATEDRERAYRYFDQIWKILGFAGDPLRKIA